MKLNSITVGGYKNLQRSKIKLSKITAIISPNNYGKTNLLEAIDFGAEFLRSNAKGRSQMMRWMKGIPINRTNETDEFFFEIEIEDETLEDYRFIRYGYSFAWYRDDGTGQSITNEWLDARPNESVRYTAYLKRTEGKYRKEKDTASFRKILLDKCQLSIDVLSSIDDIALLPVIKTIQKFDYHICSALDLGDRFQAAPIEYIDQNDSGEIRFDDRDVPRALYKLKEIDPEKYNLFLEAIYNLFPEFRSVSVQSLEVKKEYSQLNLVFSDKKGDLPSSTISESSNKIPFRVRDEMYRVLISSEYLNQPINMSMMSTGTKRIFWLLANVFIASSKNMSLIGVEELETSIHPRLLKSLLEILDEVLDNTSLIISSHSPFLVQYIKPDRIYVGIPNPYGTACFKKVKTSRIKHLVTTARDNSMAVGEFLFELLSGDSEATEVLSFFMED